MRKPTVRIFAAAIAFFAMFTVMPFSLGMSAELMGDIDISSTVDVNDARYALRAAVGLEEPTELQVALSDFSGDGSITATDARMLLVRVVSSAEDIAYPTVAKYCGSVTESNGTLGGTDDLDRALNNDVAPQEGKDNRTVGLFYFLNLGAHGTELYDITKVIENNPNAPYSEADWIAAGGGEVGKTHIWGEPLFGYYFSNDAWVYRKHLQMLTDADIDYIIFDATNAFTYIDNFMVLLDVWYKYYDMGWDVPKLAFYTNSESRTTMADIYINVYSNNGLKTMYPNVADLWFKWDGKPLIIGNESSAYPYMKNYFTIKEAQWPNTYQRSDNGWPWMEFTFRLYSDLAVYGENGRKEVISVSVAQHCISTCFSATAWYGRNDHTRSWHNGANDPAPDAYLYGYNFAEQWDFALTKDTETIFVTGWNEWTAQRQPVASDIIANFVDTCDINNSRDIEPMKGGYGDNYYMQMINYVRQYKGTQGRVAVGNYKTIDISGDFSQWDSTEITAKYTDYEDDTDDRNSIGFGDNVYVDTTGRNDIVLSKVCKNKTTAFFYVETKEAITPYTDSNRMTLFLDTDTASASSWYGYDLAVNVNAAPSANKAKLSRCTTDGQWGWTDITEIDVKCEGNKMMLAIPLEYLNCQFDNGNESISLQFKWADNYQQNESGTYDIWSFYTCGDAAPYGRMNYIFSDKS